MSPPSATTTRNSSSRLGIKVQAGERQSSTAKTDRSHAVKLETKRAGTLSCGEEEKIRRAVPVSVPVPVPATPAALFFAVVDWPCRPGTYVAGVRSILLHGGHVYLRLRVSDAPARPPLGHRPVAFRRRKRSAPPATAFRAAARTHART